MKIIPFFWTAMKKIEPVPNIQIRAVSENPFIVVSSDNGTVISSIPTADFALHLLCTEQSCQSTCHLADLSVKCKGNSVVSLVQLY